MKMTELCIHFNQPQYYPGEMVRGHVTIKLKEPKKVKGVEILIRGETMFSWSDSESYTETDGSSSSRSVTRQAKETYLKSDIKLVENKTILNAGEHTFPFAVMLPTEIPSTFDGSYGGISYYGIAKINVPFVFDEFVKTFFVVSNPLDLNQLPSLNNPVQQQNSKKFCCCCCASGPLTVVACVPKTGYSKTESIAITVEVDNASRIAIDNVTAYLCQRIFWQADGIYSNASITKLKKVTFGAVAAHSAQTWYKTLSLLDVEFPRNILNCKIITITYKLMVVTNPAGAHSDLLIEIPLTIGDIPFNDGETFSPPYFSHFTNNNSEAPPPFNPVVYTSRMKCIVS